MHIRWFRVHNGFGDYDEWELQFWDTVTEGWMAVQRVQCEKDEEMDFMTKNPEDDI